jgi:signal transduction protein with GAF and PtsI domain
MKMEADTLLNSEGSQLELVHRVSAIVSSSLTVRQMLGELIDIVSGVSSCDACLVYLLDQPNSEIVLCASQLPHTGEIGNIRMKLGEGVTGWVVQHRSVVALASHASSDPRFKAFASLPEDTYEAFLSVPLISGGDVIGVINVHHKQSHPHSVEEVSLLTYVAEQMGGAIAKSKLEAENARLVSEALEMKRLLETRKIVERAKGILQQRHRLSEEQAYLSLRSESRRTRRPMRDLAEAIILAEELYRKNSQTEMARGAAIEN